MSEYWNGLERVNVNSFVGVIVFVGCLMIKRGVFVGRFQPFHLGHLEAVKDVFNEVDELVIVIGSAQRSHDIDDPFTAGERLVMVRMALKEAGIDYGRVWVVPVADVDLHVMWVSALEGYTPKFDVVYSNEPLTRRLFVEAGYEVKTIRFHKRKVYSSTEIREIMLKGQSWEEFVPQNVAEFIKEIDGVGRIRALSKSDKL